jgi:hypothetical protein
MTKITKSELKKLIREELSPAHRLETLTEHAIDDFLIALRTVLVRAHVMDENDAGFPPVLADKIAGLIYQHFHTAEDNEEPI